LAARGATPQIASSPARRSSQAGRFQPIWVRIGDLPLFNQGDVKRLTAAVTRMKGPLPFRRSL
jgi:hypothetical protein